MASFRKTNADRTHFLRKRTQPHLHETGLPCRIGRQSRERFAVPLWGRLGAISPEQSPYVYENTGGVQKKTD